MGEDTEFMETGRILIVHGIGIDGLPSISFNVEGMSPIQAIGAVQTVMDLMRFREIQGWQKGNGPGRVADDE